jgi:hypothetical protein
MRFKLCKYSVGWRLQQVCCSLRVSLLTGRSSTYRA